MLTRAYVVDQATARFAPVVRGRIIAAHFDFVMSGTTVAVVSIGNIAATVGGLPDAVGTPSKAIVSAVNTSNDPAGAGLKSFLNLDVPVFEDSDIYIYSTEARTTVVIESKS